MKQAFLFIALLTASIPAFAYPIPPVPLRRLVTESDLIVVGTVARLDKAAEKDHWRSDIAVILVTEVLKGKITGDSVRVYYSGGMICPAPPNFFEGDQVMAFLNDDTKSPGWYQVDALSYGVKTAMAGERLQVYRDRVIEMQQVLQQPEETQEAATLQWLVRCAINPITRWEGVYELTPRIVISFYEKDKCEEPAVLLSIDDRKALAKALVSTDTMSYTDLLLAEVVARYEPQPVFDYLKRQLVIIQDEPTWIAEGIMQKLAALTGDKRLESIHREYEGVLFKEGAQAENKRKALVIKFIGLVKDIPVKKQAPVNGLLNS